MERFAEFLCRDERESGTIETYLRSLRGFAEWAAGWKTTKELLSAWKRAVRPGIPAGVGERHAGGDPGLGRDRLALLIETICATGHPGQRGAVYHGGGLPGQAWHRSP